MGMGLFDLAFIINLHFWAGYCIGSLLDRVFPPPNKQGDVDEPRLVLEFMLQLLYIGYMFALLKPTLEHLSDPLWRLTGKGKYAPKTPGNMIEGNLLLMGLTWGSPNMIQKLHLMTRPDVA